jgi:membrane protease YdiL (CAAX protease family)
MNTRKIVLYLLISFGISWLVAFFFYLLKVEYGSLHATLLIALLYMPGPALATLIIQKGIYKHSLKSYGLTISNISNARLMLIPAIFLGFVAIYLAVLTLSGTFFPGYGELLFSEEFIMNEIQKAVPQKLDEGALNLPESPYVLFGLIIIAGIFAGFSLNLPVMLGEELGWRGLLAEETRPLGFWKSNLLIGLIWGIWHAPVILLGHNYPSYPWLGILVMCGFTISLSFVMSYLRYKVKTVLAPAALHGMINGSVGIYTLFVADKHELLSNIAGAAGILALLLVSLVIYFSDRAFIENYRNLSSTAMQKA